jgi:hypothetical protein
VLSVTFLYSNTQANNKAPKLRGVVTAWTPPASSIRECIWEPQRTPLDCLVEQQKHMVLLQYVQGETHKQVVNRIQKSRGLNTVSRQKRSDMCQPTSSETNFQSLSTGTVADDREKLTAHRGETEKKHSEPLLRRDDSDNSTSGITSKNILQTNPSLKDFSPLQPFFRMIGLTPRFSAAFSEQIHSDLDCSAFTKDFNGGHKMNQKNKIKKGSFHTRTRRDSFF